MNTSNENPSLHITDLRNAEKTLNIKETSNQNNNQTPHTIDYTIISVSQEHQINFKRPALESTCLSSPLSPKSTIFIMETRENQLAKNNSAKDITKKKPKHRSRSSSSTRKITDKLNEQFKVAYKIILQNKDLSIDNVSLRSSDTKWKIFLTKTLTYIIYVKKSNQIQLILSNSLIK